MRKAYYRIPVILLAAALALPAARADVKMVSKTSTRMMGVAGTLMNMMGKGGMEQEEIIYIKGNYSRTESGNQVTIIDLSKERFLFLNPQEKTYRIMTFNQLKEQMKTQLGKLEEQKGEAEKESGEEAKKWEVLVETDRPGETQTILGVPAEKLVIKITIKRKGAALADSGGMVITVDQWLAKKHPGMEEVEAFNKKMAEKLGADLFAEEAGRTMYGPLMAQYPQLGEGLKKLAEEMKKVGKVQLRSVTRIALIPPKGAAGEKQKEEETPDLSKLSKMFGRFGKKLARKAAPPRGEKNELMETTQEVVQISTRPLDAGLFKIPADYKEAKTGY